MARQRGVASTGPRAHRRSPERRVTSGGAAWRARGLVRIDEAPSAG
jgi:hypothetical protein